MSMEPDYQAIEKIKLYRRGRAIVVFVIVMEIVSTLISVVEAPTGSLFGALLTGFFLVFVWLGKTWARVLMSVLSGVAVIGHCVNLFEAFFADGMWSMLLVQYGVSPLIARIATVAMYGIAIVYSAFAFYMFGFGKSVKTFMRVHAEA